MQKKWEKWTCVWSKIRTESGFRQANWFNGVGIAAGTHDGNGVRVCVDVADGVVNAWHWLWYWCLGFPIDFVAIYIDTYLVSNCAKWCRWMPNGKTIFYIRIWNVSARVYFFFSVAIPLSASLFSTSTFYIKYLYTLFGSWSMPSLFTLYIANRSKCHICSKIVLNTYAFHANKNGSKSFFHFSGDLILGFNDL